jgi:fermentation-respiration switch protein FrsA (DUF1100 family)
MRMHDAIWLVIRVGVASYVGLTLLLYFRQSRYVYYPSRSLTLTPAMVQLTYEDVNVTTGDGVAVHGWYVPGGEAGRTVLFCHGNAGNISDRIDVIRMFHEMGYNLCLFDYRGYGKSGGVPSEAGTYKDAEAVWEWLVKTKGVAPGAIVAYGESLGGAVAAWLAEQKKVGALILESTFTSLPDMAAQVYPFLPARWLCRFRYNTLARMPNIHCPVFVAHGRDDEMIPFECGRRLFAAANEPKVFFELQGTHNDGRVLSGRKYAEALKAFTVMK